MRAQLDLKHITVAGLCGSVSGGSTTRRVLAQNLSFLMNHYTPSAMGGVQRESE